MIVKRITDISDMMKLVPIEVQLRNKHHSSVKTRDLLEFVEKMLPNQLFYPVVIYEDETEQKPIGYIVILVIPNKLMDMRCVSVLRVWYDPHYKDQGIVELGWNIMKTICKQHNIDKIRIEVSRGAKAYHKAWGFEPIATVMERRV
jgi:hypothetical protein